MSQDWNIRSRGHVCTVCHRPLVDKSPVVSALREVSGGYERWDCHPECWKTAERDWEPFSLWDGVYAAPVREEKKEPVKKEDAGELLRQLVTLDDPAMKNVVYVLAVMLERSRILVERDAKEVGEGAVREIRRVYEDRKQGDTFVILDPRLRLENLAEVQRQVVSLLSGTKTLGEVSAEEEAEGAAADSEATAATPSAEGDLVV